MHLRYLFLRTKGVFVYIYTSSVNIILYSTLPQASQLTTTDASAIEFLNISIDVPCS